MSTVKGPLIRLILTVAHVVALRLMPLGHACAHNEKLKA